MQEPKKNTITYKVINHFVQSNENLDQETQIMLTRQVYSEVKNDMVKNEYSFFKNNTLNKTQSQRSNQVIEALIETLILGLLIGLISNQITEIILFLKGNTSGVNLSATGFWCLGLLGLTIIPLAIRLLFLSNSLLTKLE